MRKGSLPSFVLLLAVTAWGSAEAQSIDSKPEATVQVVTTADVEWGPLNPARGDKGPKAGTLWGDRTATGPSGFLVSFVDGFSSPPHIHNVSYRGVVIQGLVHNDDPQAEEMWMPAGSFWTQPAGETHITSAQGQRNVAYIEIEDGPYLVLPTEKAFDRGERPVNVDPSNIVWLDASSTTWIHPHGERPSANGPKITFLWGNPQEGQLNGSLVKLPAGFSGELRSPALRAVVIQGQPELSDAGETEGEALAPGSYFGSEKPAIYEISCGAGEACVIYVRTTGKLEVASGQ